MSAANDGVRGQEEDTGITEYGICTVAKLRPGMMVRSLYGGWVPILAFDPATCTIGTSEGDSTDEPHTWVKVREQGHTYTDT